MKISRKNLKPFPNQRSLHRFLLSLMISAAVLSCQKQPSASKDLPSTDATKMPNETLETPKSSEAQSHNEYESLPEVILAEVSLDESGNPIPGTAQVRTLPSQSLSQDGFKVEELWDEAHPSDMPTDELSTSTSSWAPIPKKQNQWDQYRPAYQTAQGNCYAYDQSQSYVVGDKRYYVYNKPAVTAYQPYSPQVTVPICGGYGGYQPTPAPLPPQYPTPAPSYPPGGLPTTGVDSALRSALAKYGVTPLADADYLNENEFVVALGERLFHDKILSAKNDVACASCHIERKGTGDAYSVGPIGDVLGGRKMGPFYVDDLLPRNSPHLFNVGHNSNPSYFWDGRVERAEGYPSGVKTPAGLKLPEGLSSPLAAQALFPLIAEKEMGCGMGPSGQSPDERALWQGIVSEVLSTKGYVEAFKLAYPAVHQFGIEHIANAIAAFESKRWRTVGSRFDQYIAGRLDALSPEEKQGAIYFYTQGGCAQCHSGPLLTDHSYHNIVVPQFGPGAGDGLHGREDWGRGRVSGKAEDRYRFKTPSLRNVTRTGPWGHNGAYSRLEDFVAHYRSPVQSFESWGLKDITLPPGFKPDRSYLGAWNDPEARSNLVESREINGVPLAPGEMRAILQFLQSLSWQP